MAWSSDSFGESLSSATRILQLFGHQFFTLNVSKGKEEFSHRGSKISIKFLVILILNVLFLLAICAWAIFVTSTDKLIVQAGSALGVSMLIITCLLMIHSYKVTPKARIVFRHCEAIAKTFEQKLKIDCDWIGFSRKFKRFCVTFHLLMAACDVLYVTSVIIYYPSLTFYMIPCYIIPVVICRISILKVLFLIRLLNHNLELMTKALARMSEKRDRENSAGARTFVRSSEVYSTVAVLKEIYGTLTEVTEMINTINAPEICYSLCACVTLSIFGSIKIFLTFNHKMSLETIGGKQFF